MTRKPHAFSTLELLAALAVLAILVALFLPSFREARARAQDTRCIGNHRSISVAFARYVQEHDGFFFDKRDNINNLLPYVQPGLSFKTLYTTDNPMLCPRVSAAGPRDVSSPRLSPNYTLINDLIQTVSGSPVSPPPGWPVKLSRVREPAKMWIYTEGARVDAQGSLKIESLGYIAPGSVELGLAPGTSRMAWPHNQRQNVLFLDGRTESLTPAEFTKKPNSAEYYALWGLQR